MAIDPTSPSGLTSGRSFMGVNYRPNKVGGTNVVNESQYILNDPQAYLDSIGASMSDNVPEMEVKDSQLGQNVDYGDPGQFNYDPTLAATTTASMPTMPDTQTGYTPTSVTNNINTFGEETESATVDRSGTTFDPNAALIDEEAMMADDSLNNVQLQNTSTVVDLSTPAGKMVAQDLGQFNYMDSRQTVMGQIEILSKHFVDPNTGAYKIPPFLASVANAVKGSLNIAGASASDITEKLASSMMTAMLPIAEKDATIFNTINQNNLTAKNTMFFNKAKIFAQLKFANQDAKLTGLVQNSQNILRMNLQDSSNEQQSIILDANMRYQALFEDAKEENLAKRFDISNQLDRDQWFTTLSANIDMRNAEMINAQARANAGFENAADEFAARAEMQMFQFEKNHQREIDQDNLNWRRQVASVNSQQAFEAAMFDSKSTLGLAQEGLNRLWNRADMQFNYLADSSERQKDRDLKMFEMKMEAQLAAMKAKADKKAAIWGALGQVGGSILGSMFGSGGVMGAGGGGFAAIGAGLSKLAAFLPFSDADLKTNVQRIGTHKSGLPLYKWDWNEKAIELGFANGKNVGVMAHEALELFPEAVGRHPTGYMTVNYKRLQ